MKISGICGSLRKNSWNHILLKIVLNKLSKTKNIDTEIINISKFPLFNADIESVATPPDILDAKEKVKNSDLNSLVYPLPQSPVKETAGTGNTVSYTFKQVEKALMQASFHL